MPEYTEEQLAAITEHKEFCLRQRTVLDGFYDNPGDPLHGLPLIRRASGLLEACCQHGCGHPIPESIRWMDAFGPKGAKTTWGVHGCDGCCSRKPL